MSLRDENAAREFDSGGFLEQASTGVVLEKYRKNERIFVQGDPAGAVGYVRRGAVKATNLSAVGKEVIVGIFRQGQFFGEASLGGMSLGGAGVRSTTIVALEDCAVTLIAKATMLSMLHSQPRFGVFFVAHLLSRNDRLEADLIDQLLHSTEQRLARLLLRLSDLGHGDNPITISLSQEALAEMVGTTRPRVSTFMNKFRDRGFIDYDSSGRLEVYPGLLLSVIAR